MCSKPHLNQHKLRPKATKLVTFESFRWLKLLQNAFFAVAKAHRRVADIQFGVGLRGFHCFNVLLNSRNVATQNGCLRGILQPFQRRFESFNFGLK